MPAIRKPTKVKQLEGNRSKVAKAKLAKAEPQPKGAPARPAIMTPVARTIWDRLVGAMPPGVYTGADAHLLAAYAEACANHQQATAALAESPELTSEGSTGQKVINPIFKHQEAQARLIVQLGARLGLDPVARQQINAPEQATKDDFDGLIG